MKTCIKCKTSKPISDFYKNINYTDKHSNYCKQCISSKEKNILQETKEWISEIKKYNPCIKCNETRSYCLDFHHFDKDKKTILLSKYYASGNGSTITKKNKIIEELKNCVSLCSNCHREFHFLERTQNIDLFEYLDKQNKNEIVYFIPEHLIPPQKIFKKNIPKPPTFRENKKLEDIKKILDMNINHEQSGWRSIIAKQMNWTPQYVGKFIRKYID